MRIQINKIIVGLLLATLLPLTFVTAFNTTLAGPFGYESFFATGSYSESFTTTTYRDLGETTADGWGTGTLTNNRDFSVQLLDTFLTPGTVKSIDIQGHTLYASVNLSSSLNAFRILDVTNPNKIRQLNSRDAWSFQGPIVTSGDFAAMGGGPTGGQGVGFYNVTYPYAPVMGTSIMFDGNLTDLEFQGHHLYVANYDSPSSLSFRIIDVENPTTPVLLSMGYLSPDVRGLTVNGHFAYLAEDTTGLTILNISAPTIPGTVRTVNTPGNAMDVLVDGSLAFVADGSGGVQIIDISTPSSSSLIGSYNTAGEARRLVLQGDTLFVADSANGLVILDVANPTHPVLVDTIAINYAWDVDLYGEIVCVGGNDGIFTYRVGMGIAMLQQIGVYDGGYEIKDVRVQGDVAYVAAGTDGFLTIDVSDPATPVLLDNYSLGITNAIKLDVQGHMAVVAENTAIHVFNVMDPSNIRIYQQIGAGQIMDVFLWGELCFYSFGGTSGAGWLNLSNPYTYTYYQVAFGTNITAIWVQGTYLYAVDYIGAFGNSFYVYDISDLSNWRQIDVKFRSGYHYDIFVDGNVAYFADDDTTGLGYASIYNITDPFNTFLEADLFNDTLGVWAYGPWLVTADQNQGVSLHNTSDLNNPATWVTQTTVTAARAVTIHGNYAYVANRTSLAILHLVKAAANTYDLGTNIATSIEVDTTAEPIENATLTYSAIEPAGTSISFEMSADGGTTWESVTPGIMHTFTTPGDDLRWRAHLTTLLTDRSVRLDSISISYEYNQPPTTPPPPPIPGFPVVAIALGIFIALSVGMLVRRQKRAH